MAIFLKGECTQPSSREVHLHHCTKLPRTSSFFSFLRLYQGNLQELSSQFPSAECSHPQHLLRVKFAAAFEGESCCAKRCLFLLLQIMQHQGQLTHSLSWRVGCMTRSAPDCGYGARYVLAGGDSEEGRLHQIGLRAQ